MAYPKMTADDVRATGALNFLANSTGAVIRSFLNKLQEVKTPEDFGCVGDYYLDDGTVNPTPTDDSVNMQKALNALRPGQKLRFNSAYFLGGAAVSFATKFTTLEGPGGIVGGTLVVGSETATSYDYFINIKGMLFDGGDGIVAGAGTLEGISFRRARRVDIRDNRFNNLNKGVSVPIAPSQQFHGTGMIRVRDNHFRNVNFGWHSDHANVTDAWMHTSDCDFIGNTINISYITGVYAKGIDGFHISRNVFFNYGSNGSDTALKTKKENNIYIGQSDWVHVTENNCFEAGLEAIWLDSPKHFNIAGNEVAWNGQKAPASAIKLTGPSGSLYGIVKGNVLSKFTLHGIEILTNLDSATTSIVTVRDNNLEYSATTSTYYGSTPLTSIDHYSVFQPTNSPTIVEEAGNSVAPSSLTNMIQGAPFSSLRFSYGSSVGGYVATVSVTGANTPIAKLARRAVAETNSYSALLVVHVGSTATQTGNAASYLLHLAKSPGTSGMTLLNDEGLTAGSTSPSWPSFTFAFDAANNAITATPLGSTSGTFYFNISVLGNVRLFKPA